MWGGGLHNLVKSTDGRHKSMQSMGVGEIPGDRLKKGVPHEGR